MGGHLVEKSLVKSENSNGDVQEDLVNNRHEMLFTVVFTRPFL